jgi:hypothetical protein
MFTKERKVSHLNDKVIQRLYIWLLKNGRIKHFLVKNYLQEGIYKKSTV